MKQNKSGHNKHSVSQNKNQKKTNIKTKDDEKLEDKFSIFRLDKLFHFSHVPVKWELIDYLLLSFITIISFTTHLLTIGEPSQVVFDEVYFGNFTNNYHRGEYYFDIHPPLGKLLLYAGSLISRYQPYEVYSKIGAPLNKTEVTKLRIWPASAGAIRAPVLYIFLKLLDVSPVWCFTASFMISLDNALLVESRMILIDAFLSMFALVTLALTAFMTRHPKHVYLMAVLSGLAAGATVSIKFTGAGVALTLVIAYFMSYPFSDAFILSFISGISGLFLFFIQFPIHFALLPHPGTGCPFHPSSFCRGLERGEKFPTIPLTSYLLKTMLKSNLAINVQHSYASKWWQWPFMLGRGTYLWVDKDRQLWCVGSPAVWYSGLLGLIVWIFRTILKADTRKTLFMILGYLISYLPFMNIKRVMWNYHYFIPLLYSISMGAIAANSIKSNAYIVPALLCAAAAACYVIYFPLTYGTPLPYDKYLKIMFKCWRY
ncbi:dolichyl-phosphate-mannose-protein mannosyltransferase [Tritrichomonas foetus]|uniref:Dolichyl-phosphate-mannose-protein mannosyltransferase n=1 Tax=Tritrichomonas foetus TaxID=1144522 RepID=A0A1J4KE87_9EUKA|nr:dolichyl-phosphate-mannose-protein mannosyltransferase [Tritrichomonas foetus]|eukprot:OHT09745.1 dolichyl-phosphate-mannose-protein mannosyltransferase [Tritrichomonas foetus]